MQSVLFFQTGNYGEAYQRFADGGQENYRDQKRSVDYVAGLAPKAKVTTISIGASDYLTELAPNLWSGEIRRAALRTPQLARLFDEIAPTHIILRTPTLEAMREAGRRDAQVLPSFADIFSEKGPRSLWRNWQLSRALRKLQAPCYSNHSVNASRSLITSLGLPSEKIVPWDWSLVPSGGKAKPGVADPARLTAFFAGMLSEPKGVGDCLQAIAILRDQGQYLAMEFAGPGDIPLWETRATELGISDRVRFLGSIANTEVRGHMRAHDFVIVPSRHSYDEGLPNTIYEGLASRSVVIVSDHPAFEGRLVPDHDVLVYPAENPQALAATLLRAVQTPALYETLSTRSEAAHKKLYVGLEWTALVDTFLADPADKTEWVAKNRLDM